MINKLVKILLTVCLLGCSNLALSSSNNGYTTAANVYSGSSSHSWFGGGVRYVLDKWQKEKEQKNTSNVEASTAIPETQNTPSTISE